MILLSFFESFKMSIVLSKLGLIDFIVFGCLAWGGVVGFSRGVVDQFPKFVSFAITTVFTLHYYPKISGLVTSNSSLPQHTVEIFSLLLLFVLSYFTVKFIVALAGKIITVQVIYAVDRLCGGFLGIVRYLLIFSVISHLLLLLPSEGITIAYTEQSLSGNFISHFCMFTHDYFLLIIQSLVLAFSNTEAPVAA